MSFFIWTHSNFNPLFSFLFLLHWWVSCLGVHCIKCTNILSRLPLQQYIQERFSHVHYSTIGLSPNRSINGEEKKRKKTVPLNPLSNSPNSDKKFVHDTLTLYEVTSQLKVTVVEDPILVLYLVRKERNSAERDWNLTQPVEIL
jgi:hypothetical protein